MEVNQQYTKALGAEFSAPDIRDYKISKAIIPTEFPESFELTMPLVKNQGTVSSCVAHSIALVAEYYNKIQHNIDEEISVGYIYGNRVPPLNTTHGMITRYAISTFCTDGAPYLSDFPLHCEVPDIIEAVSEKKEELSIKAYPQRFTSYVSVSKESEYKTALMNGNPIIIAVKWQKDMKVKDGKFNSKWQESDGGHAMVIYGWDKDGWKVQNSWSVFWGNKGTAVWPYAYPIREAYAIIDNNIAPLEIEKPFSSNNKFVKWCVKIFNKIYSVGYSILYKLKS